MKDRDGGNKNKNQYSRRTMMISQSSLGNMDDIGRSSGFSSLSDGSETAPKGRFTVTVANPEEEGNNTVTTLIEGSVPLGLRPTIAPEIPSLG